MTAEVEEPMGLAKRSESERFTYGQYLAWDDDQRWELIDGVAYAISPAPTNDHQRITGEIYAQLNVQLDDVAIDWQPALDRMGPQQL